MYSRSTTINPETVEVLADDSDGWPITFAFRSFQSDHVASVSVQQAFELYKQLRIALRIAEPA